MKNKIAFVTISFFLGGFALGVHAAPATQPAKMMAPTVVAPGATTLSQALALPPVDKSVGYADAINAFQDADRKQAPPTNAVLFIGSSSIRLWDTLQQDFPEIPTINRGFGGSQLYQSVQFADRIAIPYAPKIVVLFAGTNDLAAGKTPEQVLGDFKAFATKIHAALPATRIVYLAINPTNARWKNEGKVLDTNYLIQKYIVLNNAPDNKMTFINGHDRLLGLDGKPQTALLRADGLHLNQAGYKVWASIIREQLIPLTEADGVARLDKPVE